MVDRQEALVKFIKQNFRLMVEEPFLEKVYKQNKKEYFTDQLRNKIQIKDAEIAKAALDYMIKINFIKDKDTLERILQLSFFSRDRVDYSYYVQKLDLMNKRPDLDLGLIDKEEYKTRKFEEIKDQVVEVKDG